MRYWIIFSILIGFFIGCSGKDPVSSNGVMGGLVGYWPMDKLVGDTVLDTAWDNSGNNNHIGNSSILPVWKTDSRIGAVDFNGSSSYLERADSVLSYNFPGKEGSVTGSMTITAWIYPELLSYQMIAAKDHEDGRSFNFAIERNGPLSVQIGASDSMHNFNGDLTVEVNSWNHVAMVYTYMGDTNSIISTYIDGIPDSSAFNVIGPINATATPFRVGGRSYSGQLRSFNGLLDEVRIYNRALTAVEILSVKAIVTAP